MVLDTGGFGDLLSDAQQEKVFYQNYPLNKLYPDPEQPRYKDLTKEGVEDILLTLVDGRGIDDPLDILPEDDTGKHKIVNGGRRWLAANLGGLEFVPVIVDSSAIIQDDKQRFIRQVLDNLARKDLDPREVGKSYHILNKVHGMAKGDIARCFGKTSYYVSERLSMYQLEADHRLHWLNDLYDTEKLKDPKSLIILSNMAKKNDAATKRLVAWAVQNNCLNRPWVEGLKDSDLSDMDSILAELDKSKSEKPVKKKDSKSPGTGEAANSALKSNIGSEEENHELFTGDNDSAGSASLNVTGSGPEDADLDETATETDQGANKEENSSQGASSWRKRPIGKAAITVTYEQTLCTLLLDRVDTEEGYAWILPVNAPADAEPLRVLVDTLVLVNLS
jgi:ParB/RepB/Spo0J family partition protein